MVIVVEDREKYKKALRAVAPLTLSHEIFVERLVEELSAGKITLSQLLADLGKAEASAQYLAENKAEDDDDDDDDDPGEVARFALQKTGEAVTQVLRMLDHAQGHPVEKKRKTRVSR